MGLWFPKGNKLLNYYYYYYYYQAYYYPYPQALHPIEGFGQPTDCWADFHFSVDRGARSSGQFKEWRVSVLESPSRCWLSKPGFPLNTSFYLHFIRYQVGTGLHCRGYNTEPLHVRLFTKSKLIRIFYCDSLMVFCEMQDIKKLICSLLPPREPHWSTRLLKLTSRWQYEGKM